MRDDWDERYAVCGIGYHKGSVWSLSAVRVCLALVMTGRWIPRGIKEFRTRLWFSSIL